MQLTLIEELVLVKLVMCLEYLAAMQFVQSLTKKKDPEDYIHEWYHKNKYIETYKHTLNPINGPDEWKKYGMKKLLPPLERKQPGGPKRNRNPEHHETNKNRTKLPRTGRVMTCGICHKKGHNKKGCPDKRKVSQNKKFLQFFFA